MLLMASREGLEASLVVLGALVPVLLITLSSLLAAGPLTRLIGHKIEAMITRLLGVVLTARSVIDGIRESFSLA